MFLQGKRAMITGSTSGIGLAIARALRAEGAEIVERSARALGLYGHEWVVAKRPA